VARGNWSKLLAPALLHVQPLFRLLRLPLDSGFPRRFRWMHALAVTAHLASVLCLFLLCRRWFARGVAPLAAAALFGWHALGAEAMVIKSANSFVWSLPFLLAAIWWMSGAGESVRRHALAGLACLAAVGIHSLGAAAAIPGILAAYYLLGRPGAGSRRADRAAWGACGVPFLTALVLWFWLVLPTAAPAEQMGQTPNDASLALARLGDAVYGTILHFGFLVWRRPPGPVALAAAALALASVGLLLRRATAGRWLLAVLAVAAGPALAAFLARTSAGYQGSRYAYQSFMAVAVAGGCVVHLLERAAERRPAARRLLVACLLAAAAGYWWTQQQSVAHRLRLLQQEVPVPAAAWFAWDEFLDRMAAEALASGRTVRLPWVELYPGVATYEVFAACRPRGQAGVEALAAGSNHAADCLDFQRRFNEVKQDPIFPRLSLPASVIIVRAQETPPPGDHLVCRMAEPLPGGRVK
jgi:hypothetical protein